MITMRDLVQISPVLWEIPRSFRADMRVPARLYASRRMLDHALADRSLEQLVNATTLPGVVGHAIAMPDVHQGYGFPVGGVAATQLPHGVISPGAIGYDINCGVRLLASALTYAEIRPHLADLATTLYRTCPSGVGTGGSIRLSEREMDAVLGEGALWCLRHGLADEDDLEHCEANGQLAGAAPKHVSERARERGRDQMGTLGAGNHFIEVDRVSALLADDAAAAFGLFPEQVVVLIHCGSRGLGHQVCTDHVRDFQGAVHRYGIQLPDRELVCAPLDSDEGAAYLGAMNAAANFAFANRQTLAALIRQAFAQALAGARLDVRLRQVYDVAHNIGKVEHHRVDGRVMAVCVHRKGATRAFPPGHAEIPAAYRGVGQPVLVPGSMGSASYVLAGSADAMEQSFGSSCHGAGRALSRTAARKRVRGDVLKEELGERGIHVRAGSLSGLAEEAPEAYKPVEEVVEIVEEAGLARAVARLEPLAVIKG